MIFTLPPWIFSFLVLSENLNFKFRENIKFSFYLLFIKIKIFSFYLKLRSHHRTAVVRSLRTRNWNCKQNHKTLLTPNQRLIIHFYLEKKLFWFIIYEIIENFNFSVNLKDVTRSLPRTWTCVGLHILVRFKLHFFGQGYSNLQQMATTQPVNEFLFPIRTSATIDN